MTSPLILIDAYSQIFRAFYAIRYLSNSKGEPTNAIFVFARILLKLQSEHSSDAGAMLFDCGKVQFRLELAPQYKANRPPMPEELKVQIPIIRELACAFGWPLLEEPEYEADDLIAAFARNAKQPVLIVSADKDLSQLVNSQIKMLIPAAKNGFEERGIAEVMTKFGVPPELIVDFLAMTGDNSDNIPGVPGVGPKSAAQILNAYGSSEKWLDDLSLIDNPKIRAKLADYVELIRKNRKLVTLRDDLPARFTPPAEHLRRTAPDWNKIREICERMELHSIIRELPPVAASTDKNNDLFGTVSTPKQSPPAPQMEQGELF
ncbi:MAG: hypothetical protein LBM70_02520 [Victivallales bacterium]|jgi:DNA polymerase-1|nr:hypothetical protein [Victivallales bacterium]